LTFSQLLRAITEVAGASGKEILDKLLTHFLNSKEVMQNPKYWNSLPLYLLLGAIESGKVEHADFIGKF
jgi:hypothetical protein